MQTVGVLAQIIGRWELVLILAVVLILFGAKNWPNLRDGLGKGLRGFLDASNEIQDEGKIDGFKKPVPAIIGELEKDPQLHQPDYRGEIKPFEKSQPMKDSPYAAWIVWLAQGFGVGRIPVAPGTFGSVVGVLWFLLLLASGSLWVFAAGVVFGIPFSVWCCGEAEKILHQKDPGSIVMDEIIAIPICFLGWVLALHSASGKLPAPAYFLSAQIWPWTLAVFVAFRFFDVLKPWPVKQSQTLPGGWGVTVDDVLAAGYVNLVVLVVAMVR